MHVPNVYLHITTLQGVSNFESILIKTINTLKKNKIKIKLNKI